MSRWTRWLYHELGAQHHWDLTAAPPVIRVFLLPGWLEVDLTFALEDQFGPRGPAMADHLRPPQPLPAVSPLDPGRWLGLVWHHALRARICIERGRWWQAEYWISVLRDHVITLACLRMGYPAPPRQGRPPAARRPDRAAAGRPRALTRQTGTAPCPVRHHQRRDRRTQTIRSRTRCPPAAHAHRTGRPGSRPRSPARPHQRSPVTSSADQLTTTDGSHTSPKTAKVEHIGIMGTRLSTRRAPWNVTHQSHMTGPTPAADRGHTGLVASGHWMRLPMCRLQG